MTSIRLSGALLAVALPFAVPGVAGAQFRFADGRAIDGHPSAAPEVTDEDAPAGAYEQGVGLAQFAGTDADVGRMARAGEDDRQRQRNPWPARQFSGREEHRTGMSLTPRLHRMPRR